jgi:hypothetical protein
MMKVVFDKQADPLVRLWVAFSYGWMAVASYYDSLRPDYDPKHVPPMQILYSVWPWIVGPALLYLYRFLTTGSLRPPKNQ